MKSMGVFPEPLGALPETMASGFALLRPVSERPVPVRFAEGFEPFESFVRENGQDPALLAGDLSALWTFCAGRAEILGSADLTTAASRFAGNVIAVMHPAATWRMRAEPEVGTSTMSIPVDRLVRIMVENPERREPFVERLAVWDQDDRDEQERRALAADGTEPALIMPAKPFERPAFSNGDGYRGPWSDHDAPQSDADSRISTPERFAALLGNMDALIEYLRVSYVVDVDRRIAEDGTHRVRLQPSTGTEATITATAVSLELAAGALFREVVPQRAWDADDATAASEAGRLADVLLAVAGGGLREHYPLGHRRWLQTQLRHIDGGWSRRSGRPDPDLTPPRLERAAEVLSRLDHGWWPAWTLRSDSA